MSSKRPILLMAILLLLLVGYLAQYGPQALRYPFWSDKERPLPGENTVTKLEVHRSADARWRVSFDYYYTGSPEWATLRVDQGDARPGENQSLIPNMLLFQPVKRGSNQVTLYLNRPADESVSLTREVNVVMSMGGKPLASQKLAQAITWPGHRAVAMERELATKTPQEVLARAVELIDKGSQSSLNEAKNVLERLIEKYPRLDSAYVEMARVAMKLNWGPEGLRQAESLIGSAMEISPDSVNAKILLAYVYAYQKRYKESEELLVAASKTETSNLWLWTNWGELFELQGKVEPAIAKFRMAIARPPVADPYDRARRYSFEHLFNLMRVPKDIDAIEALHKQRTADYGAADCYGLEYARFVLGQRGDAEAAIGMARSAGEGGCDAARVREVLGLAHYVAWGRAKSPERAESLRQARVYLPVGPSLFYLLASSDSMMETARQLVAQGERIDQHDNNRYDALSYALRAKDLAVARRLLRLGARPDATVGEDNMPVALVPVLMRDFEGIRLMQRSGVDYSKLRHQGSTAFDHARSAQDKPLLEALDPKSGSL